MLKKAALAVFGLVLALSFSAPKAQAAEVHFGVAIGTPAVYSAVTVQRVHYGADDCPPNTAYGYDDAYGYSPYAGNSGTYYYSGPYYSGSYYGSQRYYYAPAYRDHWRDRDNYWRYRHERLHDKLERKHERWHEKHHDYDDD